MVDAIEGVLLRGPDGPVYFIPASDLTQYKVDNDSQARVNEAFESQVAGYGAGIEVDDGGQSNLFIGRFGMFGIRAESGTGGFKVKVPPGGFASL